MIKKHTLEHDTRILRKNAQYEEIREMLERMGLKPKEIESIDTSENTPKLEEAIVLVEKITESITMERVFNQDEHGRYDLQAKLTAIAVMRASIGIMDNFGVGKDHTPYYAGVSRWLDVNRDTLRNWWIHREAIQMSQGALGFSDLQRMTSDQIDIMTSYTEALKLSKEDLDKMVKTPQGLKVMLQVITHLSVNVKMLHTQKELMAGVAERERGKPEDAHHVAIVEPAIIEGPGNANSPTDKK